MCRFAWAHSAAKPLSVPAFGARRPGADRQIYVRNALSQEQSEGTALRRVDHPWAASVGV